MKSNQIEIKKVRLKHLAKFARRSMTDSAFGSVAPISLLRAQSQARNPCAEPDDIALLLALHNDHCIGYHGLLPGVLTNGHQHSKIYWLVTFFLDPAHRGQGCGKQIVAEILNTGVDLVTTGITRGAEAVYRSSGFQGLGELSYYQLRPATRDAYRIALRNIEPGAASYTAREVPRLSRKFRSADPENGSAVCFLRDLRTINWMIANPWIESRSEAREDVKRYYFSRVRDLFKFVALEIAAPGQPDPVGYLVLSISRKKNKSVLKILDFYFWEPAHRFLAGYFALKYAADYRIDRLEFSTALEFIFNEQAALKKAAKRKKRLYLFHPRTTGSQLASLAPGIELHYCDSDTAFT